VVACAWNGYIQYFDEMGRTYFTSAELAQSQIHTKFKARLIKEMMLGYQNYLFFEFATPVFQEFERLNSLFQQTRAYPHELYQQIFLHQKNLQNRLYNAKKTKKILIKLILVSNS